MTRAQRRPLEASRQVLMVTDVHLAARAAPALLKTVEEPPPATVFVLVADDLPPCAGHHRQPVRQGPVRLGPRRRGRGWLVARGFDPAHAESVARASGGRSRPGLLLADDAGFVARQDQWRSVPSRLDGSGAVAAGRVRRSCWRRSTTALAPLREQHDQELAALAEQAELLGAKGIPGRKQIEDRHKREERRWRTEELRFGFALLAEMFRDRLVAVAESGPAAGTPGGASESHRAVRQVEAIDRASEALDHNVNESLLMDALMVELSGMTE